MISHRYKCIFVHIQRTGGSSIELAVQGEDQFYRLKHTKHILASTAKEIYADYWDEYFKFSFVRNPWDRMYSFACLRWEGIKIEDGKINLKNYINNIKNNKFELPKFSLSYKRKKPTKNYTENAIYSNILNEKLDFIGRFENLKTDFQFVCDKIGLKANLPDEINEREGKDKHYSQFYDNNSICQILNLYRNDRKFNYTFEKQ